MKTALKLALVSRLAYSLPGKIHDTLQMPRLRHLHAGGAQGFVAGGNDIIIALRGTDELQDWMDNLHYSQTYTQGGRIHSGFAGQVRAIWPSLLDAVKTYRDTQKVWVTGHSLGGALAVYVAKLLANVDIPSQVYTYGAPKVFDPDAAAEYPVPMRRFVNNEDIVPHLPVSLPGAKYADVGDLTHFREDGQIGTRSRFYRIRRALLMGLALTSVQALRDHQINEYLRKIRLNLEQ